MAAQQPYQLYVSNPLTPALTDIAVFQPNNAGATEVGASTIQAWKDLFIPYKIWSGVVSLSGGTTFTVINEINQLADGTTFTFSVQSNGVLWLTASGSVFTTNKAFSIGSTLNAGGVTYFLNGIPLDPTIFEFDIVKHDGTQTGTPNFTQILFEVRVYN